MKGELSNCSLSGCQSTFTKSRNNHTYCSSSCRVKGNRRKNGKPDLPAFIRAKDTRLMPTIQTLPYQIESPISIKTGSSWRYLLGIGGLGYGAFTSEGSLLKTSIFAGLGYLIGKSIDDSKESKVIVIHPAKKKKKKKKVFKSAESNRLMNSRDYRSASIGTIGLSGKYKYLMGDPSAGFYAMITGSPGHGKSTFSTEFAQYFEEHHGKVLYLASEQSGLNKPLQDLLNKVNATFTINTKPTNKVNEIISDSKRFDLLVIDSINNLGLTPDDIDKIREANPKLAVLAIMQSTKDGTFKGDQRFKHDCDIFLKCNRPKVYQTKSRYSPPSDIVVFENL